MRDSARRPCAGPASRMIVPVSAMATAHPLTVASIRSRSSVLSEALSWWTLSPPAYQPIFRQVDRHGNALAAGPSKGLGDGGPDLATAGAGYLRLIVDQAVSEQLERAGKVGLPGTAVVPGDCVFRCCLSPLWAFPETCRTTKRNRKTQKSFIRCT